MALTLFSPCPMRFRVFLLLFVWIVVVSFSSADLFDLQDEVAWSLVDLQQAIEPDLEEVRDEAAPTRVVIERLDESLSVQPSLVHYACLASYNGSLLTHCLLSKLSVYRL